MFCETDRLNVVASPGMWSISASLFPKILAQLTQSSMETFWTGIKGQTSSAPVRGCSPERPTHRFVIFTSQSQSRKPCFRMLLTRVFAHVNKAEGLSGSVQCPLHHVLRGPDKGVNRSVGGGSGVHVQQAAPRGVADCCSDGINDLKHEKNYVNYQIKIYGFFLQLSYSKKQWPSVTDKYWKCGNKWTGMFYLLISALREVRDALHQPSHGSTMTNNLTVHRSMLQPKKRERIHSSSPESLTVVQRVCI